MRQNDLKNGLVMWMFPKSWSERLPRWVQSWLRNFVFGMAIYVVVNTIWSVVIYQMFKKHFFPNGDIPSVESVVKQVCLKKRRSKALLFPFPLPPPFFFRVD